MYKRLSLVFSLAVLLVVALSFASAVAAQESPSEETTMMAADTQKSEVKVKTDKVSVERKDGKVAAQTSNGSTSNETSSQQSSLTVQQNQADEGSGSEASTGDVNVAQNSAGCKNSRDVKTFSGTQDREPTESFQIDGEHFRIRYTTDPVGTSTSVSVEVDVLDANDISTGEGFEANDGGDGSDNIPEGPGTFKLDITAQNARYDITIEDCRGSDNDNNANRNNNRNRNNDNNRNTRIIRINDDNDGGAARRQYGDTEVIVKTIPDKGRLADTGGSPLILLAGAALLSTGLLVGRSVFRRDP